MLPRVPLRSRHAAAVLATALLAGLLHPARQFLFATLGVDVRSVALLSTGYLFALVVVAVLVGGVVGRWIGGDVDVPRSYPTIAALYLAAGLVGVLVGFAANVLVFPDTATGGAFVTALAAFNSVLSWVVPFALAGLVGASLAAFSPPRTDAA